MGHPLYDEGALLAWTSTAIGSKAKRLPPLERRLRATLDELQTTSDDGDRLRVARELYSGHPELEAVAARLWLDEPGATRVYDALGVDPSVRAVVEGLSETLREESTALDALHRAAPDMFPAADRSVRILVLFADPLVDTYEEALRPSPGVSRVPLDQHREARKIVGALVVTGASVEVRFRLGTLEALQDGLHWADVVHISGHGTPHGLVLTDETGELRFADREVVARAFRESRVRLVFVSTCHSEDVGRSLLDAGVRHVVAVRLEDPVLDDAAVEAASAFYSHLLRRGTTVKGAYDAARDRSTVATLADDCWLLLAGPDVAEYEPVGLYPLQGQVAVDPPPVHGFAPGYLRPLRQTFVGRERELHEMLKRIHRGACRWLVLTGGPGVGKTEVALALLHRERLHVAPYPDGIYFVELAGRSAAGDMDKAVRAACGVPVEYSSFERWATGRRALVVLDNLEGVLVGDSSGLCQWLDSLHARCPGLVLVGTCWARPPVSFSSPAGDEVRVSGLDAVDAGALFARESGLSATNDADENRLLDLMGGNPLLLAVAAPHVHEVGLTRYLRDLESGRSSARRPPGTDLEAAGLDARLEPTLLAIEGIRHTASATWSALVELGARVPADVLDEASDELADDLRLLIRWNLLQRDPEEVLVVPPALRAPAVQRRAGDAGEVDRARMQRAVLPPLVRRLESAASKLGRDGMLEALALLERWEPTALALHRAIAADGSSDAVSEALLARGLLSVGQGLSYRDLFDESLRCYRRAHDLFLSAEDPPGQALALIFLGRDLHHTDALDAAEVAYRSSAEIFADLGEERLRGHALRGLAELHLRADRLQAAEATLAESSGIFRAVGDIAGEADAMFASARLHERRGEVAEAERLLASALERFRAGGHLLDQANILLALGQLRLRLSAPGPAQDALEAALEVFEELGHRLGEGNAHLGLGDLHERMDRVEEARRAYAVALDTFKDLPTPHDLGIGNALAGLGKAETRLGRLDEARDNYVHALEIFARIDHPLGAGNAWLDLGDLHRGLDEMGQARAAYEKALEIHTSIGEDLGRANALERVAGALFADGRLEESLANYEEAVELHDRLRNPMGVGAALVGIARVHTRSGNPDEGVLTGERAVHVFRSIELSLGETNALLAQAEAFQTLGMRDAEMAASLTALPAATRSRHPSSEKLREVRTILAEGTPSLSDDRVLEYAESTRSGYVDALRAARLAKLAESASTPAPAHERAEEE